MKSFVIILAMLCLVCGPAQAQTDSLCTLQWVEKQADRVDNMLNSAIRSQDPVNLIYRLMDAYLIFDAVTVAGLNCPDVREAALAGRNLSDVLNYRLEKDLNSMLTRSTLARNEAEKMRLAAQACPRVDEKGSESAFSPRDVIVQDVFIIELDLTDGLAAENFHVLSQKVEHARRTLHDIEHIAATMDDCQPVVHLSQSAIAECDNILKARNWTEVKNSVNAALSVVRRIPVVACR